MAALHVIVRIVHYNTSQSPVHYMFHARPGTYISICFYIANHISKSKKQKSSKFKWSFLEWNLFSNVFFDPKVLVNGRRAKQIGIGGIVVRMHLAVHRSTAEINPSRPNLI